MDGSPLRVIAQFKEFIKAASDFLVTNGTVPMGSSVRLIALQSAGHGTICVRSRHSRLDAGVPF